MHHQTTSRLVVRFAVVAFCALVPFIFLVLAFEEIPRVHLLAYGVSVAVALAGGAVIAGRLEANSKEIEEALERFSGGALSQEEMMLHEPHLSGVSKWLHDVAKQLRGRVDELSRLSSEQDAIMRSMTEGVVTIDSEGRVKRLNEAARHLLGFVDECPEGKFFGDVVRNPDIRRVISNSAASMLPQEETVEFIGEPFRILDIYGSPLFQDDGSTSGTLIVVRDMTRVRQLENVRRDFVANVSHELRTPITSIKGFAETLLEGAMHEPEMLRKFLGIIAKQAERLHAIFNDLLTLSKLEAGSQYEGIEMGSLSLKGLVVEVIESCGRQAASKNVALSMDIGDNLHVVVNTSLMQQALVNLVENAIKYSDGGASVAVTAERVGEYIRCDVTDTGPGIDSAHLPRLFERFYRVDQGRSRQMGGTGLGLAIVKHIAQVHGGRVEVQSELGKGSVFSLYLRALK